MKFHNNICVVIFVKINIILSTVFGLKPSVPDGVICTQSYSYTESHYVPYLETYKKRSWGIFYETKVRVNYRVEYSTQWATREVCCNGYEEIHGTCHPTCTPECKNGLCVQLNTCSCFDGYEQSHGEDYVCKPVCKESCGHGICVAPNTCSCDVGYSTKYNGKTCLPHCEENCQAKYAFCSAPNTCTCEPEFKQVEDRCIPVCAQPCVNGVCVLPDLCECNDGYTLSMGNVFRCDPICQEKCVYGTCVAPDTCECNQGYRTASPHSAYCEPICSEPCVHGSCIAPEVCDCDAGYGLTGNSTNICQPICERPCINGICVSPNVCLCEPGFVLDYMEYQQDICVPSCQEDCGPYGQCTAPNTCICHDGFTTQHETICYNDTLHTEFKYFACKPAKTGYRILNDTSNTCVPVCDDDCGPNETCVAPNTCACNEGYETVDENCHSACKAKCKPICEIACEPAGTCVSPNTCTCNSGYRAVPENGSVICEAICETECVNGFCVGPNVCHCDEGFALDNDGKCEPLCVPPCLNGTCVEPNVCQCFEGYENSPDNSSCLPVCQFGCAKGHCVAPDECQCPVGFRQDITNKTVECVNSCSPACKHHGSCVDGEGTCECNYGFQGENCEDPSVCSLWIFQDEITTNLTILDNVNQSVVDAYLHSPYCFGCVSELNNESICFLSDLAVYDEDTVFIRCIVDKDLPCNEIAEYHPLKTVAKVTGIVGGTALLIMITAFVAAYILLRRSRKRDTLRMHSQNANTPEPLGTESLLSEETVTL